MSNCGGLLNAIQEVGRDSESGQLIYRQHYDPTLVYDELLEIKETIHDILKTSAEESLSPYEVAIARADLRMHDRRKTRWIKYLASRAKSN